MTVAAPVVRLTVTRLNGPEPAVTPYMIPVFVL